MTVNNFTLTQEYLNDYFDYDQITGIVRYKKSNTNAVRVGNIAGCKQTSKNKSYYRINIQGSFYLLHRIIWMMLHGNFPNTIDHINGNGLDNRLSNIRDVSHRINMRNSKLRIDNTSTVVGVYFSKNRKKWEAKIGVDYKLINIGSYSEFFDAICARKSAEIKYGFHRNHGTVRYV